MSSTKTKKIFLMKEAAKTETKGRRLRDADREGETIRDRQSLRPPAFRLYFVSPACIILKIGGLYIFISVISILLQEVLSMLRMLLSGGFDIRSIVAYILSAALVIFFTLPVHEYAHARTAVKLGDPTPRYQGRLTLNPFAHIDYFGSLLILLVGFGWAKPVQVNARNFKNPKGGMAITAVAGPLSNLLMAFISLLLLNLTVFFWPGVFSNAFGLILWGLFSYLASINISLAVFNLIPIPPLDGSRILTAVLPDRIYYKIMQYEQIIMIVLFALIFFGFLSGPLSALTGAVWDGLNAVAALPFKLLAGLR